MARWNEWLDIDTVLDTMGLARSSKSSGIGSFFFGMGIGLIAGGATALLLTPVNGSEAREKLLRASGDLKNTVTEKVGQLTGTVAQTTGIGSTSSPYGSASPVAGYTSSGTRVGGI